MSNRKQVAHWAHEVVLSMKRGFFVDGRGGRQREIPWVGCLCNCLVMRRPVRSKTTGWMVGENVVYLEIPGQAGHDANNRIYLRIAEVRTSVHDFRSLRQSIQD